MSHAYDVLGNSQFLYSLAVECALKGLLLRRHPDQVQFQITTDANGEIQSAEIKSNGAIRFNIHNLEKLAEITGAYSETEEPGLREILAYSSNCIMWQGRNPIPLQNEKDFKLRGTLPTKGFGHYYRDFIDPFLDKVIGEIDKKCS